MAKVYIPTNLGQVKQGVAVWIPIYFVNDAEEFVSMVYGNIELYVIKPAEGSFINIPVTAGNFNDFGFVGAYQIQLPASAVDTVGQLMIYASHSDYVSTREMNFFVQVVANTTDDLASDIATIDGTLDAVKERTDSLPDDPASNTNVDANETKIDSVKVDTDNIKAKTDNLPADPASETNATANKEAVLTEIGTIDLENINFAGD